MSFFRSRFTNCYLFASFLSCFLFFSLPVQAGERCVIDFQDRKVCMQKAAKRIIALSPHITENLFSIGAGQSIVATVDFADFPEAAKSISRVGGYNISSIENIIALQPDLVVFWGSGNSQKVLNQLLQLDITVYIDEPQAITDVAKSLQDLGILSGQEDLAQKQAQAFLDHLQTLKHRYQNSKTVTVFYQIWDDPLQTLNGTHITSNLIELCGGINIFAEASSIAPVVSKEAIFELDPDVILASGVRDERPRWLDDWLAYPQLKAVKNKRLLLISADLSQRHTLRILDGAQQICSMLQPKV